MKIISRNTRLVFQSKEQFDPTPYIQSTTTETNSEFSDSIVDADGKLLWGRYLDGGETDISLEGLMIGDVSVKTIVESIKKGLQL